MERGPCWASHTEIPVAGDRTPFAYRLGSLPLNGTTHHQDTENSRQPTTEGPENHIEANALRVAVRNPVTVV